MGDGNGSQRDNVKNSKQSKDKKSGSFGFRSSRGSIADLSIPERHSSTDIEESLHSGGSINKTPIVRPSGSQVKQTSKRKSKTLSDTETNKSKKKLSFASGTKKHVKNTADIKTVHSGDKVPEIIAEAEEVTSSSEESVVTEAEILEEVVDAQGNVKVFTRRVTRYDKLNKEEIPPPKSNLDGNETLEKGDTDEEYELVDEEVYEEIEVEEEEEEEEEDEENFMEIEEWGEEDEEEENIFDLGYETEDKLELEETIEDLKEEFEELEGISEEVKFSVIESEKEEHIEEEVEIEAEEYEEEKEDLSKDSEIEAAAEKETRKSGEITTEIIPDSKPKRKMKTIKIIKKVKRPIKRVIPEKIGEDLELKTSSGLMKGERYLQHYEVIQKTIKEEQVKIGSIDAEQDKLNIPREELQRSSGLMKEVSSGLIKADGYYDDSKKSGPMYPDESLMTEGGEHERLVELIKGKINELVAARRKNKILHKSIIDYYKQKKADYVYEGETISNETVHRYHKRLKLLEEMINATAAEKQRRITEINSMKESLQKYDNKYKKEVAELLHFEAEFGKGVIDSNTGKQLDEVIVDHLVQRHDGVLKQLSEVRLRLIKLQYHFAIKENALNRLVCLEGNLNLIDYEQLRMDNQIFADKIEEREDELSRLRAKMLAIIHTYAHVLEKSDAVIEDIENCRVKLANVDNKMISVREHVNKLKQCRDGLRDDTRKMKKTAGLLTRPRLALDYEDSILKIKVGKAKLEDVITRFNFQRSIILQLRKDIQTSASFW